MLQTFALMLASALLASLFASLLMVMMFSTRRVRRAPITIRLWDPSAYYSATHPPSRPLDAAVVSQSIRNRAHSAAMRYSTTGGPPLSQGLGQGLGSASTSSRPLYVMPNVLPLSREEANGA